MLRRLALVCLLVIAPACSDEPVTPSSDGGAQVCGDGVLAPGEDCDPGIADGPGACPTTCDDANPCTTDTLSGAAADCSARCAHSQVTSCAGGDGCCAPGCTADLDSDCSGSCGNGELDPGETCDGDCPSGCDDADPCTVDSMTGSPASCNVVCAHLPVTACSSGDGCCAPGCASSADSDCSATCGNSTVEPPETCDGNCPTACDDAEACTADTLLGSASQCTARCSFVPITACSTTPDGCCPAGCAGAADPDCLSLVPGDILIAEVMADPNAVSDADGEWVELLNTTANAIPIDGLELRVDATAYSLPSNGYRLPAGARFVIARSGDALLPTIDAVMAMVLPNTGSHTLALSLAGVELDSGIALRATRGVSWQRDAAGTWCESRGAISAQNADLGTPGTANPACGAVCGNGTVEAPELCDGNCPTGCDDFDACTTDTLLGSAAGCDARCAAVPITACASASDGCCPSGCTSLDDADCSPSCGNGAVEGTELCDGNCPAGCDDANPCTADLLLGAPASCDAHCSFTTISACSATVDGCCPNGCTSLDDADCSQSCGNGSLEPPELCDGNCPTACDDSDNCTVDTLIGDEEQCTAECAFTPAGCSPSTDGCCPGGCSSLDDADCQPVCGNGAVEGTERCDGNCPTSCNDADTCTIDSLAGSSQGCDALCTFLPNTLQWTLTTVDTGGELAKKTSLKVDAAGGAHVAYYDDTLDDLKYAYRPAGGHWATSIVDEIGDVGRHPSLALDPSGGVHVSYLNDSQHQVRYAYRPAGGGWTIVTAATNSLHFTALALDSTGGVHIAFVSSSSLAYAHRPAGGSFSTTFVDSNGTTGWEPAIAVDASGAVHISYLNYYDNDLLYAYQPAGGSWSTTTLDADAYPPVGSNATSIAIDAAGGAHVSYRGRASSAGSANYAFKPAGGSWSTTVVEDSAGKYTSLALDGAGGVRIVHTTASNYHLHYSVLPAGGAWATTTIADGQYSSLAVDSTGAVHVSFQGYPTTDLKYALWQPCP